MDDTYEDFDTLSLITRFNGATSFDKWKTSIRLALRARGLWNCVQGRDERPDANMHTDGHALREWKLRNYRALYVVYDCLDDAVKPVLRDDVTARELWQELNDTYGRTTTADVAQVARKLFDRVKMPGETMAMYLNDTTNLYHLINDKRPGLFSEELFVIKLCIGVPPEFAPTTMTILAGENMSIHTTKQLLLGAAASIETSRKANRRGQGAP
ncbi:unnamed protein product [Parajaminaea phylloscopi]